MREIAFDTETTGLEWTGDDRIIEVGCVELHNHIPTGRTYRRLINPGRAVSQATIDITGITDDMLDGQPAFEGVADELMAFFGDATIIAHNAKFDRGFLNMELERLGRAPVPDDRWIDTRVLAKERFPGAQASLDALCKRFNISLDARTLHGALLDAQLLADVYLELRGGRARAFAFEAAPSETDGVAVTRRQARQRPKPLPSRLDAKALERHNAFLAELGGEAGALWLTEPQADPSIGEA